MQHGRAFLVVGHSNWGKSRTLRALSGGTQVRTITIDGKVLFIRRMSIAFWVISVAHLALLAMLACTCTACCCSGGSASRDLPTAEDPSTSNVLSLETVWTVAGDFTLVDSLAVDPRTWDVYGLRNVRWHPQERRWTAEICRITSGGAMKSVVKVGGDTDPPTMLGVGRLARGGGLGFVVAARGRKSVRAFANDGKLLWSRTLAATASPRTVRAVDVDGDGVDEVILGTGGDGVFALDATGQQRWHSLVDSFVFDIAVVPGGSKERPLIAVGGTGSFLRLLDATGEVVRKIHAEMAFYRVASRIAPPDKYEIIGGAAHPVQLQSVTIEGASRWYVRDDDALFRRTRMSTIAVSPDGRWVAVTMKDSRILVYDAADGRRVSMRFTGGSTYPALVWTFDADGSTPLLIQAASYGMAAFRLSAPAR